MALLSGARNQSNSQLSEEIFRNIKKHFPDHKERIISASVLVANSYASSGDLDKSSKIKSEYLHGSVKKKAGISWTEVNGDLVVS